MSAVGTVTLGMIGLAGRELGGSAIGLVAAGFAALYPVLWVVDGSVLPAITSRGPHATIVMIGHRTAEFVAP